METYAVFGKPILHSRSPQLFNSVFKELNIDAVYTRIRPKSGKDIVNIIRTHDIKGANITTPYKSEVIEFLDCINPEVNEIGGVNTIANNNGKLTGYNTDHIGVSNSLLEAGIDLRGKKILVIGAGPAAAAAAFGLKRSHAEVYIANRTKHKAEEICKKQNISLIDLSDISKRIESFDVVVSALLPDVNPLEHISIPKHLTLLDANYRPSKISSQFASHGCNVISGKHWLIHQAIASYKIFKNATPPIETMAKAVEINLKRESIKAKWLHNTPNEMAASDYDILISAENENEFKKILDEEINSTFGS
jgi:shikimate dehydrogenase